MKIRKYTVLIQSLMIAMIFFLVYLAAEGLVSAIRIGVTRIPLLDCYPIYRFFDEA